VSGRVDQGALSLKVDVAAVVRLADFTRRTYVEGPIVAEVGLVLAIVALALIAAEYLAGRRV